MASGGSRARSLALGHPRIRALILGAALCLTTGNLHAQSTDEPSVVDTWLVPATQLGIASYFDLVSKLTPEQARAWVLYANMKGYQLGGEKGLENVGRAWLCSRGRLLLRNRETRRGCWQDRRST